MSNAPDPADVTSPDLPRDPADYAPRRRGLGAAFWAMIAFGVLCAVAGGVIGRYGPQLFPKKPEPAASSPAPAAPQPVPSAAGVGPAPGPLGATTPAPASADVAARLDRLQTDQRRIAAAAGEALAAAALSDAARSSRPFAGALADLQRSLPDSAALRALQPLAQAGAPSPAALAAEFARQADRASAASRAPTADAGLGARLSRLLAEVFTVRRIAPAAGGDSDAVLARAQLAADNGDLEAALRETDALPPAGREALADWRARAQRRIDVDRLIAAVRAGALRQLAAVSDTAPPT
jgi:hypothetical protein